MSKMIEITKDDKVLEVTEKAYRVVYKSWGYKPVELEDVEHNGEPIDYFELTAEELKKIKNDNLKAFLDQEGIEYPSNANKDELVALIVGDGNGEE